jgi:homopolymeric O-antigen transport system permease protein
MSTETVEKPVAVGMPEAAPAPETIRLQATRRFGRVLAPHELWRYRDLAFQIAARDVTVRYRQTALGAAWAILQPVGFMIVFSLFFGRVCPTRSSASRRWSPGPTSPT